MWTGVRFGIYQQHCSGREWQPLDAEDQSGQVDDDESHADGGHRALPLSRHHHQAL